MSEIKRRNLLFYVSHALELVDRLGFVSSQSKVDFDGVFVAFELWRKDLESCSPLLSGRLD